MPRTRCAPTCSYYAHMGTILNALLNYIFARRNGSEFLLRLDRHPHQAAFETAIVEDLKAFGFIPDRAIFQREREARYREVVEQILQEHPDKIYFCDCSVADITFRGATGSKMEFLHREEKYPSPCEIVSVQIFGPEDPEDDLVQEAEVQASLSSREHPVEHLADRRKDTFWKPKDEGYLGNKEPSLSFRWAHPRWVSEVEIAYRDLPLRCLSVRDAFNLLARVEKPGYYYYAQHRPQLLRERISFAPARTYQITLDQFGYFSEVKKEYYYDGFCRTRGLKLPLNDSRTTLRIKNEEAWWLPDVSIWFDGQADLALTSSIDDRDYGIDLRIRGSDIKPFTLLEAEAAELLGENIPNLFHPMLVDQQMVKFSKFVRSPRAAELLNRFSADLVLSYLAFKAGLLPYGFKPYSLGDLAQAAELESLKDYRIPIVCSPEEELEKLCASV